MTLFQRIRTLRTCPSCARRYASGTRFCRPCEDPLAEAYDRIIWELRGLPEMAHVLEDGPEPQVMTNPMWFDVDPGALEDVRSILDDTRALIREPAASMAASA